MSFENKSFVQFGEYLGPQGAQVVTNIYAKKNKRFCATSRKHSKYLDLFSNATLSVADLKKYYVYTYMHSIYIYINKAVIFHKAVIFQLLWLAPHGSFFLSFYFRFVFPGSRFLRPLCAYIYIYIYIYNYTHKNKHKQINKYIYIYVYLIMNYRSVSSFDQENLVVYIRNLRYPI